MADRIIVIRKETTRTITPKPRVIEKKVYVDRERIVHHTQSSTPVNSSEDGLGCMVAVILFVVASVLVGLCYLKLSLGG